MAFPNNSGRFKMTRHFSCNDRPDNAYSDIIVYVETISLASVER